MKFTRIDLQLELVNRGIVGELHRFILVSFDDGLAVGFDEPETFIRCATEVFNDMKYDEGNGGTH